MLSRFCARECEAKKALEHEEKSMKKTKAPSVKAIKHEFALFCLQGEGDICRGVCMYLRMYICMWGCKYVGMYVWK